ncbi:MAG: hypothetical protein KC549_18570 [Myxococcales bacterium]|nr:hypothetical protein [Myxococcales bacterium]MCB9548377.1 hypothetical protein [Myxococcales bacterium]
MAGFSSLTLLVRQGGLTVVTDDGAGRVLLRSVLQADGDLLTTAVPDVTDATITAHFARLTGEMEAMHRAVRRITRGLGVAVAGVLACSGGAMTDGEPGTWLAWLGGSCAVVPGGVGLFTLLRARRWVKRQIGRARGQADADEA